MKHFSSLIILSLITKFLFSQSKIDNSKISNFTYPKPTINNCIHWLNISTKEWETEMKTFQFSFRNVEDGGVSYGSGADLKGYVYDIAKYPGNIISIEWANFEKDGVTKLDDLLNELEPYFKGWSKKAAIFKIKNNDLSHYEFSIIRDIGQELAFVKIVQD